MKQTLFLIAFVCVAVIFASAQSTEFTYQGSLSIGSPPAPTTGNYDFEFRLFSVDTGGSAISTLQRLNTTVVNGVFSVKLDFGAQFPGASRYLEIAVKPAGGGGGFQQLLPRHQISSTPYSMRSLNAAIADSIPVGGLPAGSGNYIQNQNASAQSANFNINGSGLIGGNLGIGLGNSSPGYVLDIGQRMRLRSGTNSAGIWLNNTGNSEAAFIGMEDDTHVGLYGNSGAGWKFGMNTTTGALRVNGAEGQAGQVITSNGSSAAQWKSPTNLLYQRTTMVQDTGSITPGGVALTIPGLSQTVNISGNAKLLVQFGVQATTLDCIGCSASEVQVSLTLNGATQVVLLHTLANNNTRGYISGSRLLTLGTGNYTVEVKALSIGPLVQFGRCSVCNAQSNLTIQVIPE